MGRTHRALLPAGDPAHMLAGTIEGAVRLQQQWVGVAAQSRRPLGPSAPTERDLRPGNRYAAAERVAVAAMDALAAGKRGLEPVRRRLRGERVAQIRAPNIGADEDAKIGSLGNTNRITQSTLRTVRAEASAEWEAAVAIA